MSTGKYISRVVRYLIRMVVLLGLIFALMVYTNTSEVGGAELLSQMFHTQKGVIMLVALFGVALAYPKFGYVTRRVSVDMVVDRDKIIEAMNKMGYMLQSESAQEMLFGSEGIVRKIVNVGNDQIVVRSMGTGVIEIEGLRKWTVLAEFRLNSVAENR